MGFFSGILGGLSTFYGPPILTYLISVNLSKEFFIRTIATMYFIGSIPLYGSLLYHGLGTLNDLFVSIFLIVPALIGQYFGTKIRHKLSNEIFRKSILITLMMLGLIYYLKFLIMHKKLTLTKKICKTCKLEFTWRKKWKLNWDRVKYCSKKCSKLS